MCLRLVFAADSEKFKKAKTKNGRDNTISNYVGKSDLLKKRNPFASLDAFVHNALKSSIFGIVEIDLLSEN